MQSSADRFLKPENSTHRKYEALRALFVDGISIDEAAGRFGYAAGTLRNLRAAFLREPDEPFFLPDRRGRRRPQPGPDRDARIIALRKERNLSAAEIADLLTREERIPVSETTAARVIRKAGLPKLWRRSPDERSRAVHPEPAAVADRRALDLTPRSLL